MEVTILDKLGKGATAVVWKARVSGREVALKQISLKSMKRIISSIRIKVTFVVGNKSGEIICKHEYDLVKSLSHPNVIKYGIPVSFHNDNLDITVSSSIQKIRKSISSWN